MGDTQSEGSLFEAIVWVVGEANTTGESLGLEVPKYNDGSVHLQLRAAALAIVDAVGDNEVLGVRADLLPGRGDQSPEIAILVATDCALLASTVIVRSGVKASVSVRRRPWSGFAASKVSSSSEFKIGAGVVVPESIATTLILPGGDKKLSVEDSWKAADQSADVNGIPRLTAKLLARIAAERIV